MSSLSRLSSPQGHLANIKIQSSNNTSLMWVINTIIINNTGMWVINTIVINNTSMWLNSTTLMWVDDHLLTPR